MDPRRPGEGGRECLRATTVVPGLLLLSLLPAYRYQIVWATEPIAMTVHYGFDRVRFVHPVLTGASLRDRIVLSSMEERPGDRLFVKLTHTLEVRGVGSAGVPRGGTGPPLLLRRRGRGSRTAKKRESPRQGSRGGFHGTAGGVGVAVGLREAQGCARRRGRRAIRSWKGSS